MATETTNEASTSGGTPQPLPALSREALQRVAEAEKAARAQYDNDKWPYFPRHPEFSFHETSLRITIGWVIEYMRLFAEAILDAHLSEYLAIAPIEILTNPTLVTSISNRVSDLTAELWNGYISTLFIEPSSRRARYAMALQQGTIDAHPELEPSRYPDADAWAEAWEKLRPEIDLLDRQWQATRSRAIEYGFKRHRISAASKLGIRLSDQDLTNESAQPELERDSRTKIKNGADSGSPEATPASTKKNRLKKQNPLYKRIDLALRQIAGSGPTSQREVFEALDDRRVPAPDAKPFKPQRGWQAGFKSNPAAARAWLSKRWAELDLAPLPRGPKAPKR